MDNDYRWFNKKCEEGSLTYGDKKDLFNQIFENVGIKISNREKDKLENMLKEALFLLKSSKDESSHVIAHNLLTCFIPLMNLPPEKYTGYMQQYEKAMKGHTPKCKLKINYQKN